MSSFTKKNLYSNVLYLKPLKKNLIKKPMLNLSIRIDKDYINHNFVTDLINSFCNLSNKYKFKKLLTNITKNTQINIQDNKIEKETIKNINIIACICVHERPQITKLTLEYLNKLDFYKIIICYSNIEDYNNLNYFHNKDKFIFINHENKPVSLKWNKCIKHSQQFSPDAVMILGDDDLILDKYLDICKYYIKNGYDYISNNSWCNLILETGIICKTCYNKKRLDGLGAGRVISKNVLDKYNFNIYNFHLNKGLDKHSFNIYKNSIRKYKIFNEYFIFSYTILIKRKGISSNGNYLDFILTNKNFIINNIFQILNLDK